MDVLHAGLKLEKEILAGQYGCSGSRFPSVRELTALIPCSYVTAVKTAEWLRNRRVILQDGGRQYVITGRCALDSELEKRLAERRRACYGMILPSADNSFFNSIFRCVQHEFQKTDEQVLMMIHSSDEELERRQLQLLLEMGASGVLFFSHRDFNNHRYLETFPLPVVGLGRDIHGFSRSIVTVNNFDVGKLAAQHLIKNGYTHFFYIGLKQTHAMKDMRLKGFASCLKNNGFSLPPENIMTIDDAESLHLEEALSTLPAPLGIFCYHDLLAVSCLKSCLNLGKNIPQEIGIIGCDDLPITTSTLPRLSTVHYPYGHIAKMAVNLLKSELDEGISLARCASIKPRVIERESTQQDIS